MVNSLNCLLCDKEIEQPGICDECQVKIDGLPEENQLKVNEIINHRAMVNLVDEVISAEARK